MEVFHPPERFRSSSRMREGKRRSELRRSRPSTSSNHRCHATEGMGRTGPECSTSRRELRMLAGCPPRPVLYAEFDPRLHRKYSFLDRPRSAEVSCPIVPCDELPGRRCRICGSHGFVLCSASTPRSNAEPRRTFTKRTSGPVNDSAC